MSAIARYFKSLGAKVSGYDKTPTALTERLQQEGIDVHFEDDVALADTNADLVILTPAIPKDHKELNYFLSEQKQLKKRSEVLGIITKDKYSICVAGTHGKTTTSAMIAHVLHHSGKGCTAFLGGIASNYQTNYWSSSTDSYVVEADEFDRSFLQLSPSIAIITAMDADHLDIYGTEKTMQDAFIEFSSLIKNDGTLIIQEDVKRLDEFAANNKITYSANSHSADVCIENLKMQQGSYVFDVVGKISIENVELNMGGLHNVENALAAIIAAKIKGLNDDEIRAGISSFKGVHRRFEYIIKTDKTVFIDDYAHHPEELRALILSAKKLFPEMKCTVIFQPHLFSRTKDLAPEFAEALSLADETLLLPIYPARELPMEGVSSELILNAMTNQKHILIEKDEAMKWINEHEIELLITAGAGDIDKFVSPIKEQLQKK